MIKKEWAFTVVLLTVFVGNIAIAGEFNIKPGMWETTYSMKMEGVPPQLSAMMQQQQKVERECVKDNKVDFVPKDMGDNCTFNKKQFSANKLTWNFKCTEQSVKIEGKGEINYNATSVSGSMDVKTSGQNGAPMRMLHLFKGKRTGSC